MCMYMYICMYRLECDWDQEMKMMDSLDFLLVKTLNCQYKDL